MNYSSFAYLALLLVIILSLYVSHKVYPKMLFPRRVEMFQILPVLAFFIIWDFLVTGIWWEFNYKFIFFQSFYKLFGLPLEEILFFFVVPFALLTFFKNILHFIKDDHFLISQKFFKFFVIFMRIILFILACQFLYSQQWYSFTIVFLLQFVDYNLLQVKGITVTLLFTLFTTLIFNFYLTYLPVVIYNESYKTGLLVGTIPIEDFGYAIILYLLVVKATYLPKRPLQIT